MSVAFMHFPSDIKLLVIKVILLIGCVAPITLNQSRL